MIALDTNILIRVMLQDDAAQARAAERLFVRARREQTPLFIADIVLCEFVWVLTRRAGFTRADIADAVERVLRTELIAVSDASTIEAALAAYRAGRGDFADYLVRAQAIAAGATEVVTFDRALKGEPSFRVLSA